MNNQPLPLLTVNQAADELCISPRAVLHRIAKGQIAATKIGAGRTSAYVIAASEVARIKSGEAA